MGILKVSKLRGMKAGALNAVERRKIDAMNHSNRGHQAKASKMDGSLKRTLNPAPEAGEYPKNFTICEFSP